MKFLPIILFYGLLISSCNQTTTENNGAKKAPPSQTMEQPMYSEAFLDHCKERNIRVSADTLFFQEKTNSDIAILPHYLPKNQEVTFYSKGNSVLKVTQVNYTDLAFKVILPEGTYTGMASLRPYFYLGTETTQLGDGEYLITPYYVTESTNSCIDYIGFGNQNIAKDATEATYAVISPTDNGCENELESIANKKLIIGPSNSAQ